MAASTTAAYPDNSTDANFRAWATLVSNAFSAAGWVQASDTGQINLTTVLKPGAVNTSQGFQIWRTNDALTTWYAKVEYGSGAASASTPGMWITIGTGTNGSGTLTGQVSTRQQFYAAAPTAGTQYNCHFSGSSSRFVMSLFTQASTSSTFNMMLCLERTKDSAGADSDVGMTQICYGAASISKHQTVPKTGTIWSADNYIPAPYPRNATNVSGTVIGTVPVFSCIQIHYPAICNLVGFFYNDLADSVTFTLSRYGTNRTYMACRVNSTASPTVFGGAMPNSYAYAILYE